jgi:hypothetical protein
MVFVDGENLAIRLGSMIRSGAYRLLPGARLCKDTYAWNPALSGNHIVANGGVIRTYYYTAVQGDHPQVDQVGEDLKALGVGAPRVFKKRPGGRSKRVDITLATDMLVHATRRNYDIAVLVAGDEDYVPLVQAVQAEGRGVHLWSIPDGLSPALVHAVDEQLDISYLLAERTDA